MEPGATVTTAELVDRLGGKLVGAGDVVVRGINALDAAGSDEICPIGDPRHASRWPGSNAAGPTRFSKSWR